MGSLIWIGVVLLIISIVLYALGAQEEIYLMSILASLGAMIHILNHALLKGGLFLGEGGNRLHLADGGLGKVLDAIVAYGPVNQCLVDWSWFHVFFCCTLIGVAAVFPVRQRR